MFGLAYSVGEIGFVEDELGKKVVEAGYGKAVSKPKEEESAEANKQNRADNTAKETR